MIKKMKLKKMTIRNFKGIGEMIIEFYNNTEIVGENGSCKTSIGDAFNWCLNGKNIVGESKFDIRPKDADGNDVDFKDIYVGMELEVDGEDLSIEKTQKQNWVRKRGEENQTFSGNINSFVVNTIPKSETEFKKMMAELIDEEVFKFASNTNAFMNLKPADRRKTLFELVSGIGIDEVVASNDKLLPILEDLKKHGYDDIKARTTKAIAEFKKLKTEIPSRIDEVSRKIVEEDYSLIEKELVELEKELESIEVPADNSEVFERVNAINVQIYEKKHKISQIEKDLSEEKSSRINDIGIELINAEDEVKELQRKLRDTEISIESVEKHLSRKRDEIKSLGADLEKAKLVEFDNTKLVCPVCQSSFSEDKKSDMIAKFEKDKADTIAKINVMGSGMKKEINELKEKLVDLQIEKNGSVAKIEELTKIADVNKKQLSTVKEIEIDFTKDKEWLALTEEVEKLTTDLAFAKTLISDDADAKREVKEKQKVVKDKIDNAKEILNGKKVIQDAKDRVAELTQELREIDEKLTNQEKYAYLLEAYNKAKANLLSDRINEHFKIVKWKLFRDLVNGGQEECCEPMVNGKPYASALNSGHRILAELDIINALQKIYDCNVPVFLDNAERVNSFNLPKMDCQLIAMRVGDNKVLEIKEV